MDNKNTVSTPDQQLASAIYETFHTSSGKTVLAWILNQCGYFVTDPNRVSVDLVAFANRLLQAGKLSIFGNMGVYTQALIESYENSTFERS